MTDPITPPPPHLLKKFSEQAREDSKKRGHPGYCKTFAILCIEWAVNSQSTPNDRQIRSSDITPPPELVQQWTAEFYGTVVAPGEATNHIATRAAQWGADQELEACCEWVAKDWTDIETVDMLRAARRPKPPSLKEQALADLDEIGSHYIGPGTAERIKTIRRALEALPND